MNEERTDQPFTFSLTEASPDQTAERIACFRLPTPKSLTPSNNLVSLKHARQHPQGLPQMKPLFRRRESETAKNSCIKDESDKNSHRNATDQVDHDRSSQGDEK